MIVSTSQRSEAARQEAATGIADSGLWRLEVSELLSRLETSSDELRSVAARELWHRTDAGRF